MSKGPFELTHIEHTDRPVRWALRLAYIVFDAILYVTGLYLCLEAGLLRVENTVSMERTISVIILFGAYIVVSRMIYVNIFRAPMLFGLGLELATMFVIVAGGAWLSMQPPSSLNFAWLPWWWHRLPDMLGMFFRLSPLLVAWLFIGFVFLTSQVGRRRPRKALIIIGALACLVLLQYALVMGRGFRVREFLLLVLFFGFTFQAGVRGRPRLFARTLLICFIASFCIWHFLGLTPVAPHENFLTRPGVSLEYPPKDREAPVSPTLVADIEPCPAGGLLYVAGGRSGYLLGIDTGDGTITRNVLQGADFTRIVADPWNHNIYAIDAAGDAVLQFSPGSLKAVYRKPIATDWGFAPRDIIPADNKAYVSYTEYPGVALFRTEEFIEEAGIRTQKLPVKFNTGAWAMVAAPEVQSLYIVSGHVKPDSGAAVTAIDLIDFAPTIFGMIPDSGPSLINNPGAPVMYATSFFKDKIYEIDQETLAVKRTLPGPAYARAAAFDSKRNYLYAGGQYNGRLEVIDVQSGKMVSSHFACNRIVSVKMDYQVDRLWLACNKGIYRISLPEYLGEVETEPAPEAPTHSGE